LSFLTLRIKLILIFIFSQLIFAANAPYSYSYTPKFVYQNQVFPVTILVKHYNPKDPPHFEYDIIAPLQPIDLKPTKLINKNEAFFTFYFKADTQEKNLVIPQLSIWNLSYTYILHPKKIAVKNLDDKIGDNFSGIIASNLRINDVKINPYDSSNSIVTLRLEASEANLEDISLPNVADDGIENIKRDGARVTEKYYFIIPSNKKSIDITYYNLIKNKIDTKTIDLKSKNNYIDPTELNPKDLSFEKIKKYLFIGLIVIFLLLLIFTKDILYLIVTILLIALATYIYYPKGSICIQEGASLYILPTSNSEISQQIDNQIETKVIKKYKNFTKIEYKNKISGWIKDEDICKN